MPRPLWGLNLRAALGKAGWTKLRKSLLEQQGNNCAICAVTNLGKSFAGHEVWNYREGKGANIATLIRIDFVCDPCHSIAHFGRTTNLLRDGAITKEQFAALLEHAYRVNGCTPAEFKTHFLHSRREWELRSAKAWTVDYGAWASSK